MQAIGKIGLCIPEITDSLDFEMLDGMFTQAQALGYDLLLFTGVYNIHTNRGYISEVAELCGNQSLRHFTRQFGQYTGITPTDYRKKHS